MGRLRQKFPPPFPHPEPLSSLLPLPMSIYLRLHRDGKRGSALMFGKTLYGTTFRDIPFVPLQSGTFCVQCELISASSKPYCCVRKPCSDRTFASAGRILAPPADRSSHHRLRTRQLSSRSAAVGARPCRDRRGRSLAGSIARHAQPASRSQRSSSRCGLSCSNAA